MLNPSGIVPVGPDPSGWLNPARRETWGDARSATAPRPVPHPPTSASLSSSPRSCTPRSTAACCSHSGPRRLGSSQQGCVRQKAAVTSPTVAVPGDAVERARRGCRVVRPLQRVRPRPTPAPSAPQLRAIRELPMPNHIMVSTARIMNTRCPRRRIRRGGVRGPGGRRDQMVRRSTHTTVASPPRSAPSTVASPSRTTPSVSNQRTGTWVQRRGPRVAHLRHRRHVLHSGSRHGGARGGLRHAPGPSGAVHMKIR